MFRLLALLLLLPVADPSPEALVEARHYKRARPILEAQVQRNPNDAQAVYLLSKVKEAFHDYEGAMALAEKAVTLNPKNAAYHIQLGMVIGDVAQTASKFAQLGHVRRFRKEFETALSLDPKSIEARQAMMTYYIEAPGILGGDRQKAQAMAQEIQSMNPARGYLAQARIAQKDSDKHKRAEYLAILQGLYERAVAADPKNLEARVALANIYLDGAVKKYDLGEQQAREVLKLDSDRVSGYSLMAVSLALQERWSELDAILAQSEKAIPDNLAAYWHAGRNLVFTGKDLPRAERYFRKYLTQEPEPLSPTHAWTHWQLGLALEKQGRKAEAIAALETAVRLAPDFEPAKKDLKRVKG